MQYIKDAEKTFDVPVILEGDGIRIELIPGYDVIVRKAATVRPNDRFDVEGMPFEEHFRLDVADEGYGFISSGLTRNSDSLPYSIPQAQTVFRQYLEQGFCVSIKDNISGKEMTVKEYQRRAEKQKGNDGFSR